MDIDKTVNYIENSFLHELIIDEEITDISYNGYTLFYLHNKEGRKESDIKISNTDAKDFIRQIANLAEKQFSFQNPILNVAVGKYRINAVHNSIARYEENPAISFAIRVASDKPRITDDSDFLTPPLISLFSTFLKSGISMIIGGITGCGKTEFQKFLLRKMEDYTRVIVIDNVLELSQKNIKNNIDLNLWVVDDRNEANNVQQLVKNALRSNPDWLIVAESRGAEMVEILNSAMTGHPIITTIHASSASKMPYRLARMVMMGDKKSNYEDVLGDVFTNFPVHIYLKRIINKQKHVVRYIDSIIYVDEKQNTQFIYERKKGQHVYHRLPSELLNLTKGNEDKLFISKFGGGSDETI